MYQMLKTKWLKATPILLALLLPGCHLGGDAGLDEPASVTQMASSANVIIKNNLSGNGADIGGTPEQYQRGSVMPGDLDGDGYADLVVVNSLCVHVIYGSPTWPHVVQVEQEPTLIPSDPNLGAGCGSGSVGSAMTDGMIGHAIPVYIGPSVAAAGDVDRDGYADFLVSYRVMNTEQQLTYLVYGGPGRLSGRQRIADFAPVFVGVGGRVNGIGDINGDGYADLAAANTDDDYGYPGAGGASTANALVFFGSATRFVGQMSVDQAGASVSVPDAANDFTPVLRGMGDLNGDGYADFVVGAFAKTCVSAPGPCGTSDRKVWMVPGGKDLAGSLQVSALPLIEGIAMSGFPGDGTYSDAFVSPLGDLDGDGFDDLAFTTSSTAGYATHILYGRSDLLAQTNQADATLSDFYALASANVDDDAILDLVVGAPNADNGNGAVYVLPGMHNRLLGSIDLSQNTFRMASSCPASAVGESVGFWVTARAGSDVDGDGLDDILVGALITMAANGPPWVSPDPATNTGHAYLVRGAAVKRSMGR